MQKYGRAVAVMLALPGVALAALRLAPWNLGTPWIQLLAFFPLTLMLTAAALAWAGLAMYLRPGGGRIILVTFIIALLSLQAGMVLPRVLQVPGPVPAARAAAAGVDRPSGRILTVMALNVGFTGVDAATLVAEVENRDVDVLALPELAPEGLTKLDAAGLGRLLPGRSLDVEWTGTGSAVFSRFPLQAQKRVPGSRFSQSRATAAIPGLNHTVHLTAVHVDSPRRGEIPTWRAELRQLGSLQAGLPAGTPAILLGDFNASADHREFRELLETGLTDAAEATGKGLTPTWPVNSPFPPFVALDHVLVSGGITVLGFDRVLVPGTDHAAVVARLALP
jgi:endonuclease/exonuclease/phosphatase (EEP) superfamily protein YafD